MPNRKKTGRPFRWKVRPRNRVGHDPPRGAGSSYLSASQNESFAQHVRNILHMLNGEWIPDVLVTLSDGQAQYTDLLNTIRAETAHDGWSGSRHRYLQESVLNRTLRRLEQEELVDRDREKVFPYRTWYKLTPAAEALLSAWGPLTEWSVRHTDLVGRAQKQVRRNSG